MEPLGLPDTAYEEMGFQVIRSEAPCYLGKKILKYQEKTDSGKRFHSSQQKVKISFLEHVSMYILTPIWMV